MRVRPNIAKNWILHHDNAPAHVSRSAARIKVMLQSPYSPYLTPCDFHLFQEVKSAVKGQRFESTEDIQRAVTQTLTL